MLSDLKYAFRQLAQSPGFAVVTIVTLALGIGACTAIFTVVNSVLLRPVAYPDSHELMVVHETSLPEYPQFSVSPANFRDWTQQTDAFASLYASRSASFNLTSPDREPVRVVAARVTGGYFATLRFAPALGRTFGPAEDAPGKNQVVVLSHAFWQKQFGGRHDIVDTTIQLNGRPYTVLGIMPTAFQRGGRAELFTPMAFTEEDWQQRGGHFLQVVGRLRPGLTPGQAQTQLDTLAARLAEQFPDTNKNWGVRVVPMLEYNTGNLRPTFYTLLAAVIVLLGIACANVANLLLARAASRQREISVRAALGASRARVIRQLLTESLVLSLCGGALGLLLAKWGLDALLSLAPTDLPRAAEIGLDARAFGFTTAVALLTGVLFGLVPAWQASHVNLVDALKEGARGASDGARRHFIRHALVVTEVALALILLSGAGLLIRSFAKLAAANPGFQPAGALTVNVRIPEEKYATNIQQLAFADTVVDRFRALPGVTSVGATHVLPFSGSNYVLGLEVEGRPVPQSDLPSTNYFAVTPDYFRAMGIPLLRGRFFTADDRAGRQPVAVISQSLAEKIFPGQDALGQRIHMTNGPQVWREIVGIVGNVTQNGFDQETSPQSYEPLAQSPFSALTFVVRTSGATTGLAASLRAELRVVDPLQPIYRLEALDRLVADSMARQRFAMTLFGVFATLALLLAALGLYGVMAYAVTQRRGEFGIRLALGAQPADVLRLVLVQAGRLLALGLALGLVGALLASRFLGSMLYQTDAHDPLTFAAIAVLLSAVGFLACWIPARRATRVDPMVALRSE